MKTRFFHAVLLFIATSLIGLLDYLTGDELDLFILYFVPIVWAAWLGRARVAMALSILSGALWFSANVYLGHAYSQPLLGLWGELVMLTMFIAAALTAGRIRRLLDRERDLNRQLTDALARIKKLRGRLPICISCKSVQDTSGRWQEIEEYFTHESEDDFLFRQTICPHCRRPGQAAGEHAQPVGAAGGSGGETDLLLAL